MPRHRLGVALLFDAETAGEIDSLRELFGDPALNRIAPHVTLVPPINVHERDVQKAIDVVSMAATTVAPLQLTIGNVSTFFPVSLVLKADVFGDDIERLMTLRRQVFVEPLSRELSYEYVPHVTLASEIAEDRADWAIKEFGVFQLATTVWSVTMLHEVERVWRSLASFPLGAV